MNLQETVLIQLRDLILRGDFEPASAWPSSSSPNAWRFAHPVRAALVTLEQEGLVEANETGKFLVRQFTPREWPTRLPCADTRRHGGAPGGRTRRVAPVAAGPAGLPDGGTARWRPTR